MNVAHPQSLPREKLLARGVAALSDEELVAVLLGTGYRGRDVHSLAQDFIDTFPLAQLPAKQVKELTAFKGIEKHRAALLLAAIELGRRSLALQGESISVIRSPGTAMPFLQFLRNQKKEHFVVLYLNARHEFLHQETVSIGTADCAIVHPREVFEPAIRLLASAIIVAHNHPSGARNPSGEDRALTQRLEMAGEILGIQLLDHLIVAGEHCTSLRALGNIFTKQVKSYVKESMVG